MKKISLFSILIGLLILIGSCNKEKKCIKISEGLYQGWFTNNGSTNPTYNAGLYLTVIDETNIIINLTGNTDASGSHIQRDGCDVKGTMSAMIGNRAKTLDVVGEITRKKGDYTISGTYSYIEHSEGLGNPNPESWEVNGAFEIKSN